MKDSARFASGTSGMQRKLLKKNTAVFLNLMAAGENARS
jgi:hypothetical protein